MLTLTIDNLYTYLTGNYPRKPLDEALCYRMPNYRFSTAYKEGNWDGKVRLLNTTKNRFGTGLLSRALWVLHENNYQYQIQDTRTFNSIHPGPIEGFGGYDLRPYQREAAEAMIAQCRGIVQIPTAGGKTIVMGAVIRALNLPTAIIVHTRPLMTQTVKVMREMGLDAGGYGGGLRELKPVTVFTVQTLMSCIKKEQFDVFQPFFVYICDEAHHIASDGHKASWYRSGMFFKNAMYRYGVSATPVIGGPGMLLECITGPLIYSTPVTDLQDAGWIAESQCEFIPIKEPALQNYDYFAAYTSGILENFKRNELVAHIALKCASQGQSVMIFVDRISHGIDIKTVIEATGNLNSVIFLSGIDPRQEIERVTESVKQGELKILIATRKLFGEGVDLPAIEVLINAAGGRSPLLFTQMFGRGLRLHKGKTHLRYVDFLDRTNEYLEEHSTARYQTCRTQLKQPVQFKEFSDVARETQGFGRIVPVN